MPKEVEPRSNPNSPRAALIAAVLGIALMAPLLACAADQEKKPADALTDANIAAIVVAANTIDIENGKLALEKSKNESVKEFAQLMVTDHTSVNEKAVALAGKLKLVPKENQASRDLVASTNAKRESMSKLSGDEFDRAYVDNEVAYHQAVLDLLDKTIVPSVENQELKDLLVKVRPAFVSHLGHAKHIQAMMMTDANIAAIVLAANTIDIENGKLALEKSENPSVKEFAQLMVTDHTSVNEKAAALAGKLKLVPVENDASRGLVASTDAKRESMSEISGAAFDRAYVDNEVAYHQAVLDMLDKSIVPSVENQELKDLLVKVRPAFVAHLEHAKSIQSSLAK